MKFTEYFINKVIVKRPYIKLEWIEQVINNPISVEVQKDDDRIRFWGFVPEINKYLRVVTLNDRITVHNAFPDRDFKL